jgi:hypothetical protein
MSGRFLELEARYKDIRTMSVRREPRMVPDGKSIAFWQCQREQPSQDMDSPSLGRRDVHTAAKDLDLIPSQIEWGARAALSTSKPASEAKLTSFESARPPERSSDHVGPVPFETSTSTTEREMVYAERL